MNYLIDKVTGQKLGNVYEQDGQIYHKEYESYNAIVNVSDKTIELMVYKEGFKVSKSIAMCDEYCSTMHNDYDFAAALSTQKWSNVGGIAVPVSSKANVADLLQSRARSAKKSINKFYNYALGDNNWQYFCTWTFADGNIRNDKDLLYDTYNRFIKIIRKNNPDVMALATYEEYDKGGYHMHALLGNCLLRLTPSMHPERKEFMYSSSGAQLFNCTDWHYGWSTVACINPNSVKEQVVNYLCKYLTKATPAPYRCKRFFRTDNLNCRDTYIFNTNNVQHYIDMYGLQQVKSINEGALTIYKSNISDDISCRQLIANNNRIVGRKVN